MASVGEAIRAIRKAKGLTLDQVADAAGTDTGNLSRLERGIQSTNEEGLRAIAKALGVEPSQFFEGNGAFETKADYHVSRVPLVYSVARFDAPAALTAGMQHTDMIMSELDLSADWIRSNIPDISDPRNLGFFTGLDDSMEETFFRGSLLFLDRGVHELKVDAVYVFSLGHEMLVKRVQRLPDGSVKIISDNKKYDPYMIEPSKRPDMLVHARVVGAWNWNRL